LPLTNKSKFTVHRTLLNFRCSGLHLWEYTFDLETGNATQRRVINDFPYTFEFPMVSLY
jgi:hypothetical protein